MTDQELIKGFSAWCRGETHPNKSRYPAALEVFNNYLKYRDWVKARELRKKALAKERD